jgi:hypothetical protein
MERWTEAVRDEILAPIAGSPPPSKFLLPWGSITRFWLCSDSMTRIRGSSSVRAVRASRSIHRRQ